MLKKKSDLRWLICHEDMIVQILGPMGVQSWCAINMYLWLQGSNIGLHPAALSGQWCQHIPWNRTALVEALAHQNKNFSPNRSFALPYQNSPV